MALLLAGAGAARAALLPTEIYYNGPLPGADADEFLEVTNASAAAVALADFSFSEGISFSFPAFTLPAGASLILAPNGAGFLDRFPDFAGIFFDVGGGLSNAGETITLRDGSGASVFSVAYDDTLAWPGDADGGGASLELAGIGLPLSEPGSWLAAAPDPGAWRYLPQGLTGNDPRNETAAVPVPSGLALLAMGLLGLVCSQHRVTKTARYRRDRIKL